MKKLVISIIVLVIFNYNAVAQELAPYIKVGESTESIEKLSQDIINVLKDNSFMILGSYSPSNKGSLKVIAFTRNELKQFKGSVLGNFIYNSAINRKNLKCQKVKEKK